MKAKKEYKKGSFFNLLLKQIKSKKDDKKFKLFSHICLTHLFIELIVIIFFIIISTKFTFSIQSGTRNTHFP